MYKGILIDLGNTICYNNNFNFTNGLREVYNNAINPVIEYAEFIEFVEKLKQQTFDRREEIEINIQNYLNYLIKYFDFKFNITIEELEFRFASAIENLELIVGVIQFLDYLKCKNKKIVILSNSTFSSITLKKSLKTLNILQYFDEVLSSGDFVLRKPASGFFELGLKVIGLKKEEVIYIGNDYHFDIIGATNLNIRTIWYNEGNHLNTKKLNIDSFNNYKKIIKLLENEEKNV